MAKVRASWTKYILGRARQRLGPSVALKGVPSEALDAVHGAAAMDWIDVAHHAAVARGLLETLGERRYADIFRRPRTEPSIAERVRTSLELHDGSPKGLLANSAHLYPEILQGAGTLSVELTEDDSPAIATFRGLPSSLAEPWFVLSWRGWFESALASAKVPGRVRVNDAGLDQGLLRLEVHWEMPGETRGEG